ncbi:MAG: 50S ribosomal protein L15e [Candidatus Hodarchaeales archaeon]|jgi:large subunit ribosomal protein L15e
MYRYISQFKVKQPKAYAELRRERLISWRRESSVVRIERPTNISRARSLGYKAKQGYVIIRVRINRGGRRKSLPARGRRSKRLGVKKFTPNKSRQRMCEERANRRFPNLEVLNSYWIEEDGIHLWYEVIFIDPMHPAIAKDHRTSWVTPTIDKNGKKHWKHRGRAYRGLTSAGKKSRGLRNKGKGAENIRGRK